MKIILTAIGSAPAVSLIRDFQSENIEIIGVDSDSFSVGFGFCDKSYTVPKAFDKNFISRMIDICKIEKPDAIIPSPDEELIVYSKNKAIFEQLGVTLLIPDYENEKICYDKLLTYKFFEENQIPTPKLYNEKIIYPAIIKPRNGRGGVGVYKVNNSKELEIYKKENIIIQEFINGIEYTVDVLADRNGNPISIVPRKRIKVESGICVKGEIIYDKEIIKWVGKIVKKLKLIGMSCIQCIKGQEGFKFIEINSRFGGGSVLSRKADSSIIPNYIKLIQNKKELFKPNKPKNISFLRYYSETFCSNISCRTRKCLEYLKLIKDLEGDIIEIGTFWGETTFAMAKFLRNHNLNKKIYACDTFKGFPYNDKDGNQNTFKIGELTGIGIVKFEERIRKEGYENIIIPIKGKIEITLYNQLKDKQFCFAFIDIDMYNPTLFAYKFLEDRITKNGILYFHDYGFTKTPGIKKVVDTKVDRTKFKLLYNKDTFKKKIT